MPAKLLNIDLAPKEPAGGGDSSMVPGTEGDVTTYHLFDSGSIEDNIPLYRKLSDSVVRIAYLHSYDQKKIGTLFWSGFR